MLKPERHVWEEGSTHRAVAGKEYDEAWEYVAALEAELQEARDCSIQNTVDCHAAEAQVARLREALEAIVSWSEAYPLDVFPEPDFKRAHQLLQAGGMTLDAISASNMRRVVEGVGKIAKESLDGS